MSCFSDHESLRSHTEGNWKEHVFRVTESPPTTLRTPVPHHRQRNKQITCTECRRRIVLEFFKCATCTKEYHLVSPQCVFSQSTNSYECDGCANGGKIAEHRLHRFEYLILAPEETHYAQSGSIEQNPDVSQQ